ncbi:rpn12 [Malassezia furfur]|nr:rpn12 [Malassezia furfur]
MAADEELRAAHQKLQADFSALCRTKGAKEIDTVASQLSQLKLMLAERELLYPQPPSPGGFDVDSLVIARDVAEIGALASVHAKDTDSFDRYWSQLKPFYLDFTYLPPSDNYEPIVGLSLLRKLSSNSISAFHMALEMLPAELVRDSPYIQHPVLLERWLMEGSYSNVWRERQNVPREEFQFFVDMLMVTIRHEIASCEEKAYDSLPLNDVATLLFFNSLPEVLEFAKERGWNVNPTTQTVEFATKHAERSAADGAERIPRRATITSNLHFARELESIV